MIRVHYESGYSQCQGSFLQEAMKKFEEIVSEDIDIYVDPRMESDKICWFGDTDQKNGQHGVNPSKCLYAQPGWGHELETRYGKQNCLFLPYGVAENFFYKHNVPEEYDIGIVGRLDGPYQTRANYINALSKRFKVFHAGLPIEEIPLALSKCKILFNCIDLEQVNIRFFEEMAIGCQLVSYMPMLSVFGDDWKHYVTFKDENELMRNAEFLLNNSNIRMKIAKDARICIENRHTFKHRAEAILNFLDLL